MLAKPDGLLAIVDDLTRSSKADGSDIIGKLSLVTRLFYIIKS